MITLNQVICAFILWVHYQQRQRVENMPIGREIENKRECSEHLELSEPTSPFHVKFKVT
jgi:hypothetical protein